MNLFGVVGQIVARDRKGKSTLLTIRYGRPQTINGESTQFVDFARVRLPFRLIERLKDEEVSPGAVVSVQGYIQGIVHQDHALGSITLVNELVALNLVKSQVELEGDAAMASASSKGQGRYLEQLNRHSMSQALKEEEAPSASSVSLKSKLTADTEGAQVN